MLVNTAKVRPDLENLFHIFLFVRLGSYDDQSVEQVDWYSVWGAIFRTSNSRDAAVGGHYQHGRHVIFERPVEEREALHVQHVYLIDE